MPYVGTLVRCGLTQEISVGSSTPLCQEVQNIVFHGFARMDVNTKNHVFAFYLCCSERFLRTVLSTVTMTSGTIRLENMAVVAFTSRT